MRTDVRDLSFLPAALRPHSAQPGTNVKNSRQDGLFSGRLKSKEKRSSLAKRHSRPSMLEDWIMNYEDFLLNELAGLSGLDEEEIREILKKIEEEKAQHERDDDAEQRQKH
jgi:hypothetical protein